MIPVLTPSEMRTVDAAAPEPVEVLIERAGASVARIALETLGGAYGRRVVVVAGKGNNGADGRAAARRLARRGARVSVVDAGAAPSVLPPCDLVIDAAYGTGFRGSYSFPSVGDGALVLAVDVPSGPSVRADVTVTFAALTPSLLFADNAGLVVVEDIGLDVSSASMHVVEVADVLSALPARSRRSHKYEAAVLVVAGSPGMGGAAALTSAAAMRAGAGYCRLASPGGAVPSSLPVEVVSVPLPADDWSSAALEACARMKAAAIGPGLGRAPSTLAEVRRFVADAPIPVVIDADALSSIAELSATCGTQLSNGRVLTPHEGEFERLAGAAPTWGEARIEEVRALAARLGATVLLKGSVTVVADPGGEVLIADHGSPALATAGTGDVLTGVIAAFLAMGLPPLQAAAFAATAHGAAAFAGPRVGLVAGDLVDLLPGFLGRS